MPAFTALTINDGATTPAAHVYVPDGKINDSVFRFKESDGVAIGDNVFTIALGRNSRVRAKTKLTLPQTVTQTINGVSTEVVARTTYVRVEFDFPVDSTPQERIDAKALMRNLLADDQSLVHEVITDLNSIY
jgi:aspartate carbamoyltransferase regulatory subunit